MYQPKTVRWPCNWLLLAGIACLLAACTPDDAERIGGRIVLWHTDDATTSAILDDLTQRFMEINPQVRVSSVAVPPDAMLRRYREAAALSLGPDIFIGDSTWIRDLAADDLIQPLDPRAINLERYLSVALENMRLDEAVYGVPYALAPLALYYNAGLVPQPADTLEQLLAHAAEGLGTAMTTQFDRALWGVQAYGGQLFGADGRLALDQGAFASWLTWMNSAQNSTGMFLNADRATLQRLFTTERVAYYVGTPADLPSLRADMPNADIRVATLPSGPGGPAGPLLHLSAFMFNSASAPANHRAALLLADFLTNNANSLRLARETGHVPANTRVAGVDARTYPIVNSFMSQARTARPIHNTEGMAALLQQGDRLYREVLDGSVDVASAANSFTATLNAALGFEPATPAIAERCQLVGDLSLWHSWPTPDRDALTQLINRFEGTCPNVTVRTTSFVSEAELVASYRTLHASNLRPDLLLLSDRWVYELANNSLIQPMQRDALQQFVPATLNTLTVAGNVYGTPLALALSVLFYNRDLVSDPARTLDDLRTEAAAGRGVAIAADFEAAYWGIPAFGGALFTPENALAVNRNAALAQWLAWLQNSNTLPGFLVDPTRTRAQEAFMQGQSAYYIGSSSQLRRFEQALGEAVVGIAALPAGPVGAASPIMRTDALMLNATLDEPQRTLAERFMTVLSSSENQQVLFILTQRYPANISIDVADDAARAAIQAQSTRVTVLPNAPQTEALLGLADTPYIAVLTGGVAPAEAAAAFVDAVNSANALMITPTAPPVERTEPSAEATEPAS